ncbi:unnamed protein product [Candidula unifasciata]|uniref:Uncharacterized protein n=1 Tax=Candidula unifasciata TaxID=100452 RepID=A0A8S3ZQQ6_9EUPU|nr:unnamed protein product [Candidula unifasciata]
MQQLSVTTLQADMQQLSATNLQADMQQLSVTNFQADMQQLSATNLQADMQQLSQAVPPNPILTTAQRSFKGIAWPQTRIGKTVESNCPDSFRGLVRWRCLDYGWEKPGPDFLDCTSAWLEKMDTRINKVVSLIFENHFVFLHAHGPLTVKKWKMKMMTDSVSWRNLSHQDRRRAATSLFLSVEDVGFHAGRLIDAGSSELTVDENIVMKVTVVDTQETHNDMTFPSREDLWQSTWQAEAGSDSITIKSTSLKIVGMKGERPVNIVFTLYKNMENMMQPQTNALSPMPTVLSANEVESYYSTETIRDAFYTTGSGKGGVRVINSKVIAASINSTKPRRKLAEPPISNERPLCSFWDMDTSGQWSQEGCQLIDTNISHTTCECDHLTNFAVLMDVTGVKLSSENELALRVITFVGCVISVICLLLSWITFLVFKNLQCDRNTIHKNLVFCLLLAEIVFLGGIAQTEPKILCSVIAGMLHYLFLSAFAWMCLEGVQLYIMLVEVFEQEKSRVHWYYLFGYGVPAIVVAVSAGVFHEGYGTDRHCWLTTDNYFIWSFVGPALAVMLINIAMLSIAVYTMCHHSIMSVTMRDRSKAAKFSSMKTFASPKLRFPDLPIESFLTACQDKLSDPDFYLTVDIPFFPIYGYLLSVFLTLIFLSLIISISYPSLYRCLHFAHLLLSSSIFSFCLLLIYHVYLLAILSISIIFAQFFYRSWVKGAVVLVVLLGLTWILGVLYLNEESVVIAYFFTVLNSLQGLFIFVFHCLKNEKVSNRETLQIHKPVTSLPCCLK